MFAPRPRLAIDIERRTKVQLAMPPAQKPAGAEGAERALPREQPVTADAATPTPANKGSASAAGAEVITMGNDDLLLQPCEKNSFNF